MTMDELPETPNDARPDPRWRRRKEARPGEILRAALDIFLERGYKAARLEDIARSAGCTKGTIFLYYAGKAELFKASVLEAMVPMLESAEQSFANHHGTMSELLTTHMRTRWHALQHSRISKLPEMIVAERDEFPELVRFFYSEVFGRSQRLFIRILDEGVARGEFRPMDTEQMSLVIMATNAMGVMWRHSFDAIETPSFDSDRYFETALDQFIRGIAATSTVGSP